MTIELTPNGVACQLSCPYCYQDPMRDAGNITQGYDIAKMIAGLERENHSFLVFGGEALLTPLPVLRELFAWGYKRFKDGQGHFLSNGVQTNGALITDEHVAMFKQYGCHVGFSLDGPDELNDTRWAGTLEKTRASTAASFAGLDKCLAAGVGVSIILTVCRGNATAERLPRLLAWLEELERNDVRWVRLHEMEVETEAVRTAHGLTQAENVEAFLRLYEWQKAHPRMHLSPFDDIARLLVGDDEQASCIWHACDPYTTSGVQGVSGQGESSNCGRTNKDGVDWRKADEQGFERQLALHRTPQSDNGCQDCRFFFACKGQCPGTAVANDWRNRSEYCFLWTALFEAVERDLVAVGKLPLSRSPHRERLEDLMLACWARGENVSIAEAVKSLRTNAPPKTYKKGAGGGGHGDHWDAPDGFEHNDKGFTIHGDAGMTQTHGDSHGDSDAKH